MNIEDAMSVEELRTELRRAWDTQYAFLDALRDLPTMPPPLVLSFLSEGSGSEGGFGKVLQRSLGLDCIPPVSECERGAGLWNVLRRALRVARGERTGTWGLKGNEFSLQAWSGDIYKAEDRADLHNELRRKFQGVFESEFTKKKRHRDAYLAAEICAEKAVEYLWKGECIPVQNKSERENRKQNRLANPQESRG